MKVDFEITFETKDLEQMCLDRCKGIETAVPGHFEAVSDYNYGRPRMKCVFVAEEEVVAKTVLQRRSIEPPVMPEPPETGTPSGTPAPADVEF